MLLFLSLLIPTICQLKNLGGGKQASIGCLYGYEGAMGRSSKGDQLALWLIKMT